MANHKSAIKRHRQSEKRNARNRAVKTRIRSAVKALRAAVESNDKEKAQAALTLATSVIDKAATKKVVHWRCAARKISRLSQAVNKIA
ncbi:small subunit ribosomal protein S20 [Desulfobaculum xiamenense]|uniref:Small ribosomal subunit protein bS20 n=1 Tax=Desulfobaculum xiamenense TaxID=995050 RepID=A0A846QDG0_9BACT|nr:30S ribosomal protein S20 [Desulfobaculum xiamenense]NJB66766.1 small subunit ribosomal protein S20 [Desulfobaculum xiamenense]